MDFNEEEIKTKLKQKIQGKQEKKLMIKKEPKINQSSFAIDIESLKSQKHMYLNREEIHMKWDEFER